MNNYAAESDTRYPKLSTAALFVEQFCAIWAAPTTEQMDALTHPDVRYSQPLLPDIVGSKAAHAYWRAVLTVVPDLHLNVTNWAAATENTLYIEFYINGSLGRVPFSWPAVDRYNLDDAGRVQRRVLYCNPLVMARTLLRPRSIAALMRIGIRASTTGLRTALRQAQQGENR